MKKLVRFRVLSDGFAAGGISLPQGDYDGEISWSEQSVMGFPNRVNGPSNIYITPASLPAARHPTAEDIVHVQVDLSAAIKHGKMIVL